MSDEPVKDELKNGDAVPEQDVPLSAESEADPASATPDETAAEPTLEEQLTAAQAEAARNLEGWQRTLAEFANARKRLERTRAEAYNNAAVDIAAKLLPVIDDFDLLLENAPESVTDESWFTGIALVRRKLMGTLDAIKLEPVNALGQPFDPNVHEAIQQMPSDEYESGIVCQVYQKGYKIGERLIRPAIVVVAE